MNRRHFGPASIACLLTLGACSPSARTPVPLPNVSSAEARAPGKLVQETLVEASAAVETVDQSTREVTLRKADGETISFVADDSVRNLAQLKPGDIVTASYYQSVAVFLRKSGDATPGATGGELASRAALGEKPGGADARSVTIVAKVLALDPSQQTATLETAEGRIRKVAVKNPESFEIAAVGDLVEITLTEAVGISVEAPKPK